MTASTAPALADPVSYQFTVQATDGPLAGQSSTGIFTYDSSIVVPGLVLGTGLLIDLAFTWDGVFYDETTANTGFLRFDINGNLTGGNFGDNCFADGGCVISSDDGPSWTLFWGGPFGLPGSDIFLYSSLGVTGIFGEIGNVTIAPLAVPEPSGLALLGLGLGALAFSRRKRPHGRHTPAPAG